MSTAARVAVIDDYQSAAAEFGDWGALPAGVEVVFFPDHVDEPDALVARLRDFDVVVVMRERTKFTRAMLEQLSPRLKLIVTSGHRNAALDIEAAADLGVMVSGTGGDLWGTIEHTWALILAVTRNVAAESAMVRAGGWQHTMGGDLHGKTLGVVGLGNMGSQVARIGQAFGMNVVAWSTNMTQERCGELGIEFVSKRELLSRSDVVTIHLQLSEHTHGLFGADDLAAMKPSAILVNTSRGFIIDEQALIDVLAHERIAGAGLDTFDIEPLPRSHPFRILPNVVATPHIGYVTRNCYDIFIGESVESLQAYLAGAPIRLITPAPVSVGDLRA